MFLPRSLSVAGRHGKGKPYFGKTINLVSSFIQNVVKTLNPWVATPCMGADGEVSVSLGFLFHEMKKIPSIPQVTREMDGDVSDRESFNSHCVCQTRTSGSPTLVMRMVF